MKCMICNNKMSYFFSKNYIDSDFSLMMSDIEIVDYYKCDGYGFVISKTHLEISNERWMKLNYDFHHFLENYKTSINQPPYLQQATMIKVLDRNGIIDASCILDYAGGYGTLSKILKKYFDINLPVYDPYIQNENEIEYIDKHMLCKYNTVLNSALFEHLLYRSSLDEINELVNNNGAMIIHTVVCEQIPQDPNWFYLDPPVHTSFHTNKSMNILMKQWGYKASIYCLSAKMWILLKNGNLKIKEKCEQINIEFQTEYLIYKDGFVDYWK